MNNVAEVAKTFFHEVWTLFLKTDVPGVGVSFAAVVIAFFLIRFSIRLFGFVSGFGMSSGDYGRAADSVDKYRSAEKWKNRNKIGF